MEKIYMEESKKQQKKSAMNFSVVLSFVVAIFAMFSLAMFGIVSNQGTGVSYAAYTGDSFSLKYGKLFTAKATDASTGKTYMYRFYNYFANDASDTKNRVFCIERSVNVKENTAYAKTTDARTNPFDVEGNEVVDNQGTTTLHLTSTHDIKEDYGLIYLLSLGSSDAKLAALSDYDTADLPENMTQSDLGAFILQSAIWSYLSEKYPDDEAYKLAKVVDDVNSIDDFYVLNASRISISVDGGTAVGFDGLSTKINSLVQDANKKTIPTVSVEVGEEKMALTEDEKFYQSSLVTVVGTPAASFESYDVTLTGIDGMIIVDEDGNEMSKENITAGTKFYVRVPADKVTKDAQTIQINAKAKFTGGSAYYYKTGDDKLQRMAGIEPKYVTSGADLVVVGDTGMNTAQTIYFIGLIVLLCGVGIVYANAKPVEAKQ